MSSKRIERALRVGQAAIEIMQTEVESTSYEGIPTPEEIATEAERLKSISKYYERVAEQMRDILEGKK